MNLTIVSSLKHENTQPLYIFKRKNPRNSEPQNGPRRGLDFIALISCYDPSLTCSGDGANWRKIQRLKAAKHANTALKQSRRWRGLRGAEEPPPPFSPKGGLAASEKRTVIIHSPESKKITTALRRNRIDPRARDLAS